MISKLISIMLVAVLLPGNLIAQDQSQRPVQTQEKMQKVLHKAQDKHKAVSVVLLKKVDKKKKFTGQVNGISDIQFVILEQRSSQEMTFAYADVQQVSQKGMSGVAKAGIAAACVGGFILIACAATHCTQSE